MQILLITGIALAILGIVLKLIQMISVKKETDTSSGISVLGFSGMQITLAGTMIAALGIFLWLHFYSLVILFTGVLIALLIYSILQGINIKKNPGSIKSNTGFTFLGIVAVIIFTGVMVLYFIHDPAIIMKNNTFEIRGPEGIKVHLDDFKAITIENFIPKIVDLYDGIQIGETYRGKFELYRTGTSLLYVDQPKSPYIFVFLKSNIGIVITRDDPDETRKLYKEIREYWNHYLQTDVLKQLKKQYVK
jgi:hypothetical protein